MDKKTILSDIGNEIRDIIDKKQKELNLSFVEDTHTYYIKNKDGVLISHFPSVSTVITQFYSGFPELNKSYQMVQGNLLDQDRLLKEWRASADYANNKGSRVHYLLDDFIRLMHRRGAVLLDTEIVLGSSELEYTGQPDKVWLMHDKNDKIGFIITDWKTNKPKNFKVQHYTEEMLPPFQEYMDTALTHYMIQLPLYGRLILDMLKGSKYEDIGFFGCVIVHLSKEGKFTEYRVPKKFMDIVLTMPPLPRITEVMEYKELQKKREEKRKLLLNEMLDRK